MVHNFVNTPNKTKRTLPWHELQQLLPVLQNYSPRTIQAAMEANGIQRVLQPVQQPLSRVNRQKRLLQFGHLLPEE